MLLLGHLNLAAEKKMVPRHYETGKIVDIQQKVNTRILYYVVNTPVTKDEPYFEISVQLKDQVYVGKYTPRHADEQLPEDWTTGAPVQSRVDEHHLYLRRPSGLEMDLYIVKHKAAPAEVSSPEAAPAKK